ncbi:MAG: glycoside hydrolase family 55 protein [Planctomycetota bacterium]|nr:glycoside hydrolase family 55 protein [Planctomycetota bacterium]
MSATTKYALALQLLLALSMGLSAARASTVNAKDFGARGDGVSDDSDALQKAIDAAARETGGGELLIPAGRYVVKKTLRIEKLIGFSLRGEGHGGIIVPKRDGPTSNMGVTRLIWKGEDGGTLLEAIGTVGLKVEGLLLSGGDTEDTTQQGRAGMLMHLHSPVGWGCMITKLSAMTFHHAATGIQMGKAVGDICGSDALLEFLTFIRLDCGFRVIHRQGVDYTFTFLFAGHCKRVLHFECGGNLLVNTAQMTDCGVFAEISGGGRNAGTYLFNNIRVESSSGGRNDRFQALVCRPDARMVVAKFIGYDDCQWDWKSNRSERRAAPLCEIGPGSQVVFESSIFNSPLAALEGDEKGQASLVVRDSSFSYVSPAQSVKANAHGYFRFENCTEASGKFYPDLLKWPKLDAERLDPQAPYVGELPGPPAEGK